MNTDCTRYCVRVWIETAIPEDCTASVCVELGTVVDIGNGKEGLVGRIVEITLEGPQP